MGVKGGEFGKALCRVMIGEEGKAMRANMERIRAKAEEAVKPEGSSDRNFKKLVDIVTGCGLAQ